MSLDGSTSSAAIYEPVREDYMYFVQSGHTLVGLESGDILMFGGIIRQDVNKEE